MTEFELINRFFARSTPRARLGVGDDCALVRPDAGLELALTTDMLVEGRHFAAGAAPRALGHKSLAVNLSDLAAMGAAPRWALLALGLPTVEEAWLEQFAAGFFALAERHGVEL
ncbi:MAG: thiamine-phosphate kinase, partial [Betaproteobacteria bacterium]